MRAWALTDRVHWMWGEFKHAIKDECATLEEAVPPVPAIVLNNVVCLGLYPEIERDEDDTANPAVHVQLNRNKVGDGMARPTVEHERTWRGQMGCGRRQTRTNRRIRNH
jgi:hypothetical protein